MPGDRHSFRGRRALGALTAVAALALGGCGDDQTKKNNAYVAATDRVVQAFNADFQALQADFTPSSTPAQDLKTLAALQTTVDRAAKSLTQVTPPPAIATLHTALIARVRTYDGVIAAARTGFAAKDPQAVATARSRFSTMLATVGTRIMQTINTINAKLR